MVKYCVVTGCEASENDFGTVLFSFPKAETQRKQWIEVLGKPESWTVPESAFICWSHFECNAIQRNESGFRRTADAIPSRFLNNGEQSRLSSEHYCRFCARNLHSEIMGNSISEMNRSEDAKRFLSFLLPEENEQGSFGLACDECFMYIQFTMRFIRNCTKASKELDRIAQYLIAKQIKEPKIDSEMDEFGEIPLAIIESGIKIEASSLHSLSDREDSFSDHDRDDSGSTEQKQLTGNYLQCAHCSFTCLKRIQLASHLKKHRDILPKGKIKRKYHCPECDFCSDKLIQIASHRKCHNKVKKQLLNTAELMESDATSSDEQEAQESLVPNAETTDSSTSISKTTTENAPETSSEVLRCSECPYTCIRPIQLASHKKKHTGYQHKRAQWEEKKKIKDTYECEFCDFKCKLRRQMAGHRASHSDLIRQSKPSGRERDHMCSICGKILSTRGSFFVHMKYHNDQRDYPCDICGKKFYSKRDVTMHVESFHEKKVYECEICGVKCTWKNALSKHMRKHDSNSYKLECSYCGKRFMAANELRLHIWRHTGQQLSCDICGAGYRFNFLLTQHKIRAHGIQIEGVKLYNRFKKEKPDKRPRLNTEKSSANNMLAKPAANTPSLAETQSHPTAEQPLAPMENTAGSSYSSDITTDSMSPVMLIPASNPSDIGTQMPLPFQPLGTLVGHQVSPAMSQNSHFNHF